CSYRAGTESYTRSLHTLFRSSVWFTKRYPKEKFLNLLKILGERNVSVFLIGGKNDMELGDYLYDNSGKEGLFNVIGKLSLLESRSEEHTSELQSRENLVCRLL